MGSLDATAVGDGMATFMDLDPGESGLGMAVFDADDAPSDARDTEDGLYRAGHRRRSLSGADHEDPVEFGELQARIASPEDAALHRKVAPNRFSGVSRLERRSEDGERVGPESLELRLHKL